MSVTVKFVYVRWSGPDVSFTKRGKFGVVHGSIEQYFSVSLYDNIIITIVGQSYCVWLGLVCA